MATASVALSQPAIDSAIESLERLISGIDEGRPGAEGLARSSLGRLRTAWRATPDLFSAEALVRLRGITTRLEGVPTDGPTASGNGRAAAAGPTARPAKRSSPATSQPRADPVSVLREVYGYDGFRQGQAEIIDALLAGRDCIGVMPTGAGKSLTYQIPARILGGTTLVVSPLIALMKDQVDALEALGIRATFLNSSLDAKERGERTRAVAAGRYELVYAAPEGLEASTGQILERADVRLIAVDEAHCISHWGHDFRPAYRNLRGLRERFGQVPILALTATATPRVADDIVTQLGMVRPVNVRRSFFRPNLHLHGYCKGKGLDLRNSLLALVRAHRGESGIIYVQSRKAAESTATWLATKGVRSAAYHAGLEPQHRSRVQDAFRRDEIDVVCATVAFGMGIDKPNIRFVLHRDMPRSPEAWYQEIGRAGRDGAPADCVIFYSWADVISYESMIDSSGDLDHDARARQCKLVREMFRLLDRAGCRHRAIVGYLGEKLGDCGQSCDHCLRSDIVVAAGRVAKEKAPGSVKLRAAAPATNLEFDALRDHLRELRRRIADSRGVPAFVVFHDATLDALAEFRPSTSEELLAVPGIGPKKLAELGPEILQAIREGSDRRLEAT